MVSGKSVFGLLILILTIHAVALSNFWYWRFAWLDMPMHFLGGFWVAMFFLYLAPIFKFNHPRLAKLPEWVSLLLIAVCFAVLVGVFWEFAEFLHDQFLIKTNSASPSQLSSADTMGDLFFDVLGALAAAFLFKNPRKKENSCQ